MTEELSPIEREYSQVLNLLKQQKKGSNVDKILLDFIKQQIKEIKEKKRNELDVGDAFQIGNCAEEYGLKFSKKMADFLIELSDYKIEQAGRLMNIQAVQKEVNKLSGEKK